VIFLFLILLGPALRAVETDYSAWTWRDWLWWVATFGWLDWLALLIAAPLDVFIAHTTWALVFGWPKPYELTISHTLERLCKEKEHPDYELFVQIAKKINRVSPTHDHIRAVLP
jgi:hypothetical protein